MKTELEIIKKRAEKITEYESLKQTKGEVYKISKNYSEIDELFAPILEKIQKEIDIYDWILKK